MEQVEQSDQTGKGRVEATARPWEYSMGTTPAGAEKASIHDRHGNPSIATVLDIFGQCEANARLIVTAVNDRDDLLDALRRIELLPGNLNDDRITSRTGANDAVARGLLVVAARDIAQAARVKAEKAGAE